jgi:hypothetical protein
MSSLLALALAFLPSAQAEATARAPAPPAVAFVGVHVLPMDTERVLRDHTVVVAGGRITAVGPAAEVEVPAGATRIAGEGRYLIPGLVDAHVHCFDEGDLMVYLANGVTTVRNLMGTAWHLELRARITRGEIAGPRFLTSGPFVNEPEYSTPDDVQRAVAEHVDAGFDCLKIHGRLSPAAYDVLLEEAALAELPVIGHAPRNLPIERVLERGGQREISHAEEYLYTHFDGLPQPVTDEAVLAIARATAESGITVTPNLVAFRSIVSQIEDLERELARPEVAYVAPPVGRGWLPDLNRYRRDFAPEDAAPMAERYTLLVRFTRALAEAGVPLLAGSDAMNPCAVPGFSLHDELELLVAAGLTPYRALRAATATAGEFLGDGSGVVAEGAPADLVLLASNPLDSIRATRAIEGVLRAGRWFAQEDLARELERRAREYAAEARFVARIAPDGVDAALAFAAATRAQDATAFVYRPEGLESLVQVYLRLGKPGVARAVAELAARERPERRTAWTSLGAACAAAGDAAAARAAYERALALRDDELVQRALAALGE